MHSGGKEEDVESSSTGDGIREMIETSMSVQSKETSRKKLPPSNPDAFPNALVSVAPRVLGPLALVDFELQDQIQLLVRSKWKAKKHRRPFSSRL